MSPSTRLHIVTFYCKPCLSPPAWEPHVYKPVALWTLVNTGAAWRALLQCLRNTALVALALHLPKEFHAVLSHLPSDDGRKGWIPQNGVNQDTALTTVRGEVLLWLP